MNIRKVFMLATAAAMLAACSTGPESVVEDFYAAVGKGEITEAQGYLSTQVTQLLPAEKLAASLREEHERVTKCGGIKTVKVKLEGDGEVRFGTATVSYRGDCPEKTEKVNLVLEQGKWKLGIDK